MIENLSPTVLRFGTMPPQAFPLRFSVSIFETENPCGIGRCFFGADRFWFLAYGALQLVKCLIFQAFSPLFTICAFAYLVVLSQFPSSRDCHV